MKIKHLILQAAVILLAAIPIQKAIAQGDEVSYQTFYDQLTPYGQWVDDPQYGNVWVPNVGGDFRPYGTSGHWVMTEYGNTWVSDYPWGWATFHYGRWTYSDYYGWLWVPGYDWGPAWVSWRNGGGYYGWAPLSPGITIGASVDYACPVDWWIFIQPQYIYRPDYYHYWGGARGNVTIINRTTFIHNTYRNSYISGPRAADIQAITHQNVPVYRMNNASRPGRAAVSGNTLNIYRPAVNRSTVASAHPAHVVRAPQAIGAPKAASAGGNRAPAFHAVMQKQGVGTRPAGNTPAANLPHQAAQPAHGNIPSHAAPVQQRSQNRPQPQTRTQPQHMQQSHAQPQRAQPQMNRPQPQQRPQPQMQQHMQAPQQHTQMQQQHMQAPQQHMQMPEQHMQAPQHMEAPHGGGGERR